MTERRSNLKSSDYLNLVSPVPKKFWNYVKLRTDSFVDLMFWNGLLILVRRDKPPLNKRLGTEKLLMHQPVAPPPFISLS